VCVRLGSSRLCGSEWFQDGCLESVGEDPASQEVVSLSTVGVRDICRVFAGVEFAAGGGLIGLAVCAISSGGMGVCVPSEEKQWEDEANKLVGIVLGRLTVARAFDPMRQFEAKLQTPSCRVS